MSVKIFQVDAFTDKPFSGNPAAVCLLEESREESWMQAIAKEMNLSETAFLYPEGDGFHLRWFTPAVEVELCGHATLASAYTLWETGLLEPGQQARFHTLSGLLTARRNGNEIEMDFPVIAESPCTIPNGLEEALGAKPRYIGRTRYDLLLELDSESAVLELRPNFSKLKQIPARGIMITSQTSLPGYDFISRFFAPQVGVDEDPVTGSAHCSLAPFWSERLGKQEMLAFQASERTGSVRVRLEGERVSLCGRAVMVLKGELIDI
jgi:PhzF family phenazine biosynthesis protein